MKQSDRQSAGAPENSDPPAAHEAQGQQFIDLDTGNIIQNLPEVLLVFSHAGSILLASQEARDLLGVDDQHLVGQFSSQLLRMRGVPVDAALLSRLEGRTTELQLLGIRRDVDMACTIARIKPAADEPAPSIEQQPAHILLARDLSERRHAMDKISSLTRLIEESPSAIMRVDASLRLLYVNATGRDFARAHGCKLGHEVPTALAETVRQVQRSRKAFRHEEDLLERTWSVLYQPVRGERGVNVYGSDITDRIAIERRLLHNAFYDELTELPNRALLQDHVDNALHTFSRRPQRPFALIEVDLDRFRYINETYGHVVGDQLLKAFATRLQRLFRARDTIARFSADAFCVLAHRVEGLEQVLISVQRLMGALAEPFLIDEHELFVSACVGIVLSDTSYESGQDMIRDADTALYRAKDRGRGSYMLFDESMRDRMRRFLSIEGRLRHALKHDEFAMHYQPKLDTQGQLQGFEALIRWPTADGGMISPAEFIPVAEDSGLIIELGDWVNNAVCQQIHAWQQTQADLVPVAINISGQQFERAGFARNFRQILDDNHVAGELVHAEITESSLMGEVWTVVKRLRRLADMGVVSAIDDFGTGYSSLAYLKLFPVSYLKIDQAFVRDMHANEEDYAITSAIIAMAHQLHLKVIAEGVENEMQLAMLNALDCDQIQGYYFSKPLAPEQAQEVMGRGGILY